MGSVNRRHTFLSRGIGAFLAILGLTATLVVAIPIAAPVTPASADTAFSPGYIISDDVFFNSSTMDEGAIASFIQREGANCSSNCLRDFRQNTNSRPADSYCNGYGGATNESAARIIEKTARSCGINPQVLLVLLEKEQTLITHRAPSSTRYTIATGYACPDTAACDERYYGFHNQVYSAARQFKIYAEGRYFTYFAPGRTWNIRWHPDATCGSAPVYIENKATAALYYYTPYQPNAAALRAGPGGTGDSCSAYGNRNFSRFFIQWFGSPTATTGGAIGAAWTANGGGGGWIGAPVDGMVRDDANGGGWYQRFANATIYHTASGTTTVQRRVSGLHDTFIGSGRVQGRWGWPLSSEECGSSVCAIRFQNGTLAWTSETNSIQPLINDLERLWHQSGGVRSSLGGPESPERWVPQNGGGVTQAFRNGDAYITPAGNLSSFTDGSGLYRRYLALGGVTGSLGWPKGSEVCANGAGCMIAFDNSNLSWDQASQTIHQVHGRFGQEWVAAGGPGGQAGAARSEMTAVDGGWKQEFQNATFYLKSGGSFVSWKKVSSLHDTYRARGAQTGPLGWPTSGEQCADSGCMVTFERGNLVWEVSTGRISSVAPGLFSAWRSAGGTSSWMGSPVADARSSNGGVTQDFSKGTGYAKQNADAQFLQLNTGLTNRYRQSGGPTGSLGWPTSGELCAGSGCVVSFENGHLSWEVSTGRISTVPQAVFSAWRAAGGTTAWMGSPIAEATSVAGGVAQEFSNGFAYAKEGAAGQFLQKGTGLTNRYRQMGGPTSDLGWPTSTEICSGAAGECVIRFERGTLVWTAATGQISRR